MVERKIERVDRYEEAYLDIHSLEMSPAKWVTVATLECGHSTKTRKQPGETVGCRVCEGNERRRARKEARQANS